MADYPHSGDPHIAAIESLRVDGVPIREYLNRHGIALQNSVQFNRGSGPTFIMRESPSMAEIPSGSRYRNGAVLLGFNKSAPSSFIRGVTAHELGHAVRYARGIMRPGVYRMSGLASGVLGMAGAIRATTSGKELSPAEAAAWSAGTALSSLPMLNEEFQASRLGSKLVGLRGLKRLSAFRGMPAYAAGAAIPLLAYGARRLFNRFGRRR